MHLRMHKMHDTQFLVIVGLILSLGELRKIQAVPQPNQNVWVTLANITGQDTICLFTATPSDPFRTCLIGLPIDADSFVQLQPQVNFDLLLKKLPQSSILCKKPKTFTWSLNRTTLAHVVSALKNTALEPQELDLYGSVKADFCFRFYCPTCVNQTPKAPMSIKSQDVTPFQSIFRNISNWCNDTNVEIITTSNSNSPHSLPQGIFLICGDRAWPGIPAHAVGGPCTIGRLTFLAPNMSLITSVYQHHRSCAKRSIHSFQLDCNDKINLWSRSGNTMASIFIPGLASAQALKQINNLGCWLAKQTNLTSKALSELLLDVNSVRHAVLQNRAAIDFLLLAQGHGCNEFEGMCCMNLSNHSQSIHRTIKALKNNVEKITVNNEWKWLDSLLDRWGIEGWLRSFCKIVLTILGIFLCILICIPCLLQCVQRLITKAINTVLLVEKKGGDVGVQNMDSPAKSTVAEASRPAAETSSIVLLMGRKPWERSQK